MWEMALFPALPCCDIPSIPPIHAVARIIYVKQSTVRARLKTEPDCCCWTLQPKQQESVQVNEAGI